MLPVYCTFIFVNMNKLSALFFLILICIPGQAQPDFSHLDFTLADSIGLHTKYTGDIIGLSQKLSTPFDKDIMKVRAIYRWVTDNIAYDCKQFNKGRTPKEIKCSTPEDCEKKRIEADWAFLHKVAKKKKAVCSGYARLFQRLCTLANIQCEVVPGAVRTKYYQVGNNAPEDHAWNAVFIDSNWYFLDATWGAGSVLEDEETGKLLLFIKNWKDLYFLTPYNKHIKNHHPQEAKWYQYLDNTTKETFNKQPFYYNASHFIKFMDDVLPDSGVLNKRVGDTIHFSFKYPFGVEKIQVNTNLKRSPDFWTEDKRHRKIFDTSALRRQVYWPFIHTGNNYSLNVPVTDRSLYYIEIVFVYSGYPTKPEKVLRYRVNVPL